MEHGQALGCLSSVADTVAAAEATTSRHNAKQQSSAFAMEVPEFVGDEARSPAPAAKALMASCGLSEDQRSRCVSGVLERLCSGASFPPLRRALRLPAGKRWSSPPLRLVVAHLCDDALRNASCA